MNARIRAGLLLFPIAAFLAAAACSGDALAPDPAALRTTSPITPEDSVYSGYGSGSTGGLEYQCFEYEPETGTEYVATPDSTCSTGGLEYESTSTFPTYTPPPPPPPSRATGYFPIVGPAESDSVQAGYGTESTGGIDYDCFEYDPQTGTETVVTDDPKCAEKVLTPTTTQPSPTTPEEP